MGANGLRERLHLKRQTSRHHFVQHNAERVDISSAINLAAFALLRSHVGRRAHACSRHAHDATLRELGQAKIGKHWVKAQAIGIRLPGL